MYKNLVKKIINRRDHLTQDWIISHPVLKRAQKKDQPY